MASFSMKIVNGETRYKIVEDEHLFGFFRCTSSQQDIH